MRTRRTLKWIVLFAVVLGVGSAGTDHTAARAEQPAKRTQGVCPSFSLRTELGEVINPLQGINSNLPYSPKQTCGATGCHDYARITEGFHFTQGAGEQPTENQRTRIAWATTPGNFGGSWCSPAPLYRYLSPKRNDSPATIDMTAYTFISACGSCHPGGGSAEFDREGHRYDQWIRNTASGFADGAENDLDGDYYQANWSKSGVLEGDCLLCHLPGYNYGARNKQIADLNYRWAATAGSGLATIAGSVKAGSDVEVTYDASRFGPDGTIELPLVRSPQNQACLNCHQQPGWKKRGANYRSRTDVHLRAGLRCVDCHPAGSSATDPRISGREVHQIAKGDDPGGLVRNDLDNTMLSCDDCHKTGRLGAPLAKHRGLPPLHLDRIACQTCHIPERTVMPIQFQAGDVFNPAPRIPKGGKQLWTFYGPDNKWRNHYGYLEMMGYDNKPTERFRPILAQYKNKIYPVNRVHSAWPGIEIEGQSALMQPRMSDVYKMWTKHRGNPSEYPALNKITDDNADGVPEVDRPEEIDAIIESVSQLLRDINYPMERKRVVWVYNDRVYSSGTEYTTVAKEPWEASPFANVHKYSHDVYPAEAALGAKGCADCHAKDSPFYFAPVLSYPFGEDAKPIFASQGSVLQYDGSPRRYTGIVSWVAAGFKWFTILVMLVLISQIILDIVARKRQTASAKQSAHDEDLIQRFNIHYLTQHFLLMSSVIVLLISAVFLWALRYSGAQWAATLSGALGGVEFWRLIHRGGAIVLTLTCAYHVVYSLLHPEGRRDFRLMIPRLNDLANYWKNIRWRLGAEDNRPKIGRFTVQEKFDYWAVFWGCAIMIVSGTVMWFPELLWYLWPTASITVFDVLKEAHAHEALLALLALSVWHMYNVHLRPGRFPGSWFWILGTLSRREQTEEHPDDLDTVVNT